jgi:tetratricopeptide (TPR) repeat protein
MNGWRASLAAAGLSVALGHTSVGQGAAQAARPMATSRREVRAELATTLLNASRFSEAATEYRRLLASDPGNRAYRLGLARALAWGDRPREAERELLVARDRQNAAVVDPLLRSVRSAFDPTAAEGAAWVRESPGYLPYRVAFARALAREDPRRAIAQFDTLRLAALAGEPQVPPASTLVREEADAYVAAGARSSAIALLGAGLDEAPADTGLRHALAGVLFDAGSFDAARAAYDTLITAAPTASAYVGRANTALALRDTAAAQADLSRSIEARPSYDGYYLLGSLARGREDFVNARLLYGAARRVAPDAQSRREVAGAAAELAREERPVVAFSPDDIGDPGWRATSSSSVDNSGVSFLAVDASRSDTLSNAFTSDLEVGMQRIAQRGLSRFAATGTSALVGLSHRATSGRAMLDAAVHAGFVAHPGIATFGRGSIALAGWLDAWELGLDLSRAPAYESLFTPAALSRPGNDTPALVANAATVSTGGPLGPVDAAASWTRTWLSDANTGESFDAYARLPVGGVSPHLFAVYEGSAVSYAALSRLYWDPVHYIANAVGPELAMRRAHGLSLAARVLAGYASDVERDTAAAVAVGGAKHQPPAPRPAPSPDGDQQLIRRTAIQLSTGGEASYRAAWWEGAVDAAYGRARAGGYQRASLTVTLRVLR